MYRTYSEWGRLAWDPSEWVRLSWDPTEWMRMGADAMSYGVTACRPFYGRPAEIAELETLKKRLEDEIADISKRLNELKGSEAKKN